MGMPSLTNEGGALSEIWPKGNTDWTCGFAIEAGTRVALLT